MDRIPQYYVKYNKRLSISNFEIINMVQAGKMQLHTKIMSQAIEYLPGDVRLISVSKLSETEIGYSVSKD